MEIASLCSIKSPVHQFRHTLISTFMGGVYPQIMNQIITALYCNIGNRMVIVSKGYSTYTISAASDKRELSDKTL